jgi:IclR family acetate operon transcriptional repressor
VRSVARALDIIETLGTSENPLGLQDLSKRLGLPHPTVHRLLGTLQNKGFVHRDPLTGTYSLAVKVLRLQATMATRRSLVVPAIPVLNHLAQELGQTVHLGVLAGEQVMYVESRRYPPYPYRYLPPGRVNPVHSSSLGKALTAFLPEEELEGLLALLSFEARTPQTLTSKQAFLECLAEVRRQRYAVDWEENEEGVCCVGAPVRDHTGRVVAAISTTELTAQVARERIPEIATVVVGAAEELSRALGWDQAA